MMVLIQLIVIQSNIEIFLSMVDKEDLCLGYELLGRKSPKELNCPTEQTHQKRNTNPSGTSTEGWIRKRRRKF